LSPASDQHPDHDVAEGEKLIKKVYEKLRKSPIWEDTLMLVFYDEHGGFFDHVKTPKAVNPDGINSTDITPPFNFDRLGVRVPAVLVSPYVKKAYVAPRADFTDQHQYSHSSLGATIREQFAPKSPPMTERDANALSFSSLVSLDYPREDCPMTLPDVPESTTDWSKMNFKDGQQPVSDLQINIASAVAATCEFEGNVMDYTENEAQLGTFVKECMRDWKKSNVKN
jgi:phospholipase C